MTWYEKFVNKHRNFGIANLMTYIVLGMAVTFFAEMFFSLPVTQWFALYMPAVMRGQIWRLVTFAFLPTTYNIIAIIISLSFYYFVGHSLENQWGKGIFTLYYLVGIVGAIIAAIITGAGTSYYLNLSLLLAFAVFFPEIRFYIYMIIPIKSKHLGYMYGVLIVLELLSALYTRSWSKVGAIIASLMNFLLFFGPGLWDKLQTRIKNKKRRQEYERNLRQGWDD